MSNVYLSDIGWFSDKCKWGVTEKDIAQWDELYGSNRVGFTDVGIGLLRESNTLEIEYQKQKEQLEAQVELWDKEHTAGKLTEKKIESLYKKESDAIEKWYKKEKDSLYSETYRVYYKRVSLDIQGLYLNLQTSTGKSYEANQTILWKDICKLNILGIDCEEGTDFGVKFFEHVANIILEFSKCLNVYTDIKKKYSKS